MPSRYTTHVQLNEIWAVSLHFGWILAYFYRACAEMAIYKSKLYDTAIWLGYSVYRYRKSAQTTNREKSTEKNTSNGFKIRTYLLRWPRPAVSITMSIGEAVKTFGTKFSKFVRREIGEIMRYLPDKKISAASQTVATARIAPKFCQGQRWCSVAGKATRRKVMAAYRRVDDLYSPVGWLPVYRDHLRAQRSVTSMGSLYLYLLWSYILQRFVKFQ